MKELKTLEVNSVAQIEDWFKAAKPNPTHKDALIQLGCHFEEVDECLTSIGIDMEDLRDLSTDLKVNTNLQSDSKISDSINFFDKLELLDSLSDQIVTAVGVGYMMGFDMQGALAEVIRSNNSKMVDGEFIFDGNGKIKKPDSFSEPNLEPFLNNK